MAAILDFRSRHVGNVRSDTVKSGVVDNMGIVVGIATPSLTIQPLFQLPVLLTAILYFVSLPSSTNVDQRRLTSDSVLSVTLKFGMLLCCLHVTLLSVDIHLFIFLVILYACLLCC